MNQNALKPLRLMILVFIFLNAFFVIARDWLVKNGVDQGVLIMGNLVLFLVSFLITQRSLRSKNHNAFIRSIYVGFILKFAVICIAAVVYVLSADSKVNKPALLSCVVLYVLYTFMETSTLLKQLKKEKNG